MFGPWNYEYNHTIETPLRTPHPCTLKGKKALLNGVKNLKITKRRSCKVKSKVAIGEKYLQENVGKRHGFKKLFCNQNNIDPRSLGRYLDISFFEQKRIPVPIMMNK